MAKLAWPLAIAACGPLKSCAGRDPHAVPSPSPDAAAEVGDPSLPGLGEGSPALRQRLAAAVTSQGAKYQARTRHTTEGGKPKYTNRLILENSPYLLQHAHNPVNWYAWSEEAFQRAAREGKPVLLSIGYSTCHWCHVMERESFEDEAIAAYINQHFVAIKVDREERPDVDALYMRAVQTLTGRGGWPMTLALTPTRQPFFGGTYFPARDGDRGARRGLWTILHQLAERFASDPAAVVAQAQQLTAKLAQQSSEAASDRGLGPQLIDQVARRLARSFDPDFGGFGRAPKFPRPAALELLMRYHRRTGDAAALTMVVRTLQSMYEGGIYDHLGGGFHRYATDARWLVPHFEKMLYDNAQLVPLYLSAYQLTGTQAFADVARETLGYVRREMRAPSGAFYSATDADSPAPGGHEEEGYFFTWTPQELQEVLSPADARLMARLYGVREGGNFEGRSILHRISSLQSLASGSPNLGSLGDRIERSRSRLYQRRLERPAPLRDDKIITAWNGLMIGAFARGARVLQDASYVLDAERAARAVLAQLQDGSGRLLRTFRAGRARHAATLEDYAFLVQGLVDLYEASAHIGWLSQAVSLQEVLDSEFWDEKNGAYFQTDSRNNDVLIRSKPTYDGARPSGNAVTAHNLLRLSALTGEEKHETRARRTLEALSTGLVRSPGGSPLLLSALERTLDVSLEVFVVHPEHGEASALEGVLAGAYLPNGCAVVVREGQHLSAQQALVPGLEGKRALRGLPTAYVCERGRCELPAQGAAAFERQLRKQRRPFALSNRAPLAIAKPSHSP